MIGQDGWAFSQWRSVIGPSEIESVVVQPSSIPAVRATYFDTLLEAIAAVRTR